MAASRFTQAAVTRSVKGAVAAGLSISQIEIDSQTGNITLKIVAGTTVDAETEPNEWDEDA